MGINSSQTRVGKSGHEVAPKMKIAQSCPALCDPMDYTVRGILQARILEWVAFPFSRRSSQPRDRTQSPTLQVDFLPAEPQGKPRNTGVGSLFLRQQIFPTQEMNWGLLHCRQILYQLSHKGSPSFTVVALIRAVSTSRHDL